jgi:hypothetical protein
MADLIPATVGTLLILLVGLLPGLPGETVYGWMRGRSWLEKDFEYFMRILGFSLAGVLIYAVLANWLGLPMPEHVAPSTFQDDAFGAASLPHLATGYLGHVIASGIVGAVVGFAVAASRRLAADATSHRDAWDEFVRTYAQGRWIVVTLNGGDSYAGMLEHADISREPEYRDVVLSEPALHDADSGNYRATSSQYLYFRGDQIASIGAVSNSAKDERLTTINEFIFNLQASDEQR